MAGRRIAIKAMGCDTILLVRKRLGGSMTYDPDKIIEVATKLKAAKDQVVALEAELRRMFQPQIQMPVPEMSTATRVVRLLTAAPSRDFSAVDVWGQLEIKESYARPLLSRLVNDGKIEKRGRGYYGALGGSKQKSLESVESRLPQ
jgi:hypothetical protein